ncbi:ribonuclease mrp protein subunit snm1 [Anaeramoeba flamelloides]|uniref:Ribonuclease mrp protein subunit snm1 n=1 Tax=Anaeramoeba flamelloides TaxID=1746091 RepID=A0AAV7ZZL7_9EUKA|nr:ribonuclease mrp protein subunit snm1 [Anaeramoeba flamelloides]
MSKQNGNSSKKQGLNKRQNKKSIFKLILKQFDLLFLNKSNKKSHDLVFNYFLSKILVDQTFQSWVGSLFNQINYKNNLLYLIQQNVIPNPSIHLELKSFLTKNSLFYQQFIQREPLHEMDESFLINERKYIRWLFQFLLIQKFHQVTNLEKIQNSLYFETLIVLSKKIRELVKTVHKENGNFDFSNFQTDRKNKTDPNIKKKANTNTNTTRKTNSAVITFLDVIKPNFFLIIKSFEVNLVEIKLKLTQLSNVNIELKNDLVEQIIVICGKRIQEIDHFFEETLLINQNRKRVFSIHGENHGKEIKNHDLKQRKIQHNIELKNYNNLSMNTDMIIEKNDNNKSKGIDNLQIKCLNCKSWDSCLKNIFKKLNQKIIIHPFNYIIIFDLFLEFQQQGVLSVDYLLSKYQYSLEMKILIINQLLELFPLLKIETYSGSLLIDIYLLNYENIFPQILNLQLKELTENQNALNEQNKHTSNEIQDILRMYEKEHLNDPIGKPPKERIQYERVKTRSQTRIEMTKNYYNNNGFVNNTENTISKEMKKKDQALEITNEKEKETKIKLGTRKEKKKKKENEKEKELKKEKEKEKGNEKENEKEKGKRTRNKDKNFKKNIIFKKDKNSEKRKNKKIKSYSFKDLNVPIEIFDQILQINNPKIEKKFQSLPDIIQKFINITISKSKKSENDFFSQLENNLKINIQIETCNNNNNNNNSTTTITFANNNKKMKTNDNDNDNDDNVNDDDDDDDDDDDEDDDEDDDDDDDNEKNNKNSNNNNLKINRLNNNQDEKKKNKISKISLLHTRAMYLFEMSMMFYQECNIISHSNLKWINYEIPFFDREIDLKKASKLKNKNQKNNLDLTIITSSYIQIKCRACSELFRDKNQRFHYPIPRTGKITFIHRPRKEKFPNTQERVNDLYKLLFSNRKPIISILTDSNDPYVNPSNPLCIIYFGRLWKDLKLDMLNLLYFSHQHNYLNPTKSMEKIVQEELKFEKFSVNGNIENELLIIEEFLKHVDFKFSNLKIGNSQSNSFIINSKSIDFPYNDFLIVSTILLSLNLLPNENGLNLSMDTNTCTTPNQNPNSNSNPNSKTNPKTNTNRNPDPNTNTDPDPNTNMSTRTEMNMNRQMPPKVKEIINEYNFFKKHAKQNSSELSFTKCKDINCTHCSKFPVHATNVFNLLESNNGKMFDPIKSKKQPTRYMTWIELTEELKKKKFNVGNVKKDVLNSEQIKPFTNKKNPKTPNRKNKITKKKKRVPIKRKPKKKVYICSHIDPINNLRCDLEFYSAWQLRKHKIDFGHNFNRRGRPKKN